MCFYILCFFNQIFRYMINRLISKAIVWTYGKTQSDVLHRNTDGSVRTGVRDRASDFSTSTRDRWRTEFSPELLTCIQRPVRGGLARLQGKSETLNEPRGTGGSVSVKKRNHGPVTARRQTDFAPLTRL